MLYSSAMNNTSPQTTIQYTNNDFFNPFAACTKKNGISLVKKFQVESFQNSDLNDMSPQDYKTSSSLFNKTDGHAKSSYHNLHLPIGKDNNQIIGRSFEKSRNNSDNIYDLGVTQDSNDGTDSGIEVIRALSSNGSNSDRFTPIQSCGSSLVSYSSEPEADRGSECGSESSGKSRVRKGSNCSNDSSNCCKVKKTYDRTRVSRKTNAYDCTSESCSETSSTHEAVTPDQLTRTLDFKRSASSRLQESKKGEKSKSATGRRAESSTRISREKVSIGSHSSSRSSSAASKSYSGNRNVKSTVTGKCEIKGSKTKGEDSRWSTSQKTSTNGARIRVSSVTDSSRKYSLNSMSNSLNLSLNGGKACEGNSNALDKYGTLPRRPKKKSAEALTSIMHTSLRRSHSVTREPSLNRAATLRRQQSKEKENSSSNGKSLPPYPRARRGTGKILIYHEVGVQTLITSEDISNTSTGVCIKEKPSFQMENKEIQTEGKERLKIIEENYAKQCEEVKMAKQRNEELELEKKLMISRICKLLGYPDSKQDELKENGLEELEKHFHAVGLTVLKQQKELSELRHYKLIANRDLEKSLAAQKNLLQQQQEIEEEYSELQEFLQAEKTALSESLLDTEQELHRLRSEASKKQTVLERLQEECQHLVRICEQRRQENLSLEAKLSGLDQRSRDVLVQQGAAVSAAAVALSGLEARLDSLLEQLSTTCNIKEKDLEDIVFHNEAYLKSEDYSPDEIPSGILITDEPKRRESFIQVILTAINNAAHLPFALKKGTDARKEPVSDQNETFFDTEIDQNLNLDDGLQEISTLPEFNKISQTMETDKKESESKLKVENKEIKKSNSLQKLSDAILNRQMVEENERSVALDEIIPIEVNSLVDQIVEVDNLVTKLLKVIKIIQGSIERHVEDLQVEKKNLSVELQLEKTHRQKLESSLQKLQQELTEARCELNTKITQLEEVKTLSEKNQKSAVVELQKRFAIIDGALGALNSVQDVVSQCPQLVKLQCELKDCKNQRISEGDDVNANSATNNNEVIDDTKRKAFVITTNI